MSGVQSLWNRLEAELRVELDAQRRIASALALLAGAVRTGSPAEIEATARSLQPEIDAGRERASRRSALLRSLGGHLGVPAERITLSTLVEHAGPSAERWSELRSRLRDGAAEIARAQRKLAASIRCQRRIFSDALSILLADRTTGAPHERVDPMSERGTLVDARV